MLQYQNLKEVIVVYSECVETASLQHIIINQSLLKTWKGPIQKTWLTLRIKSKVLNKELVKFGKTAKGQYWGWTFWGADNFSIPILV